MKNIHLLKLILFLFLIVMVGRSLNASAISRDKVVLQLRWNHQFQYAGYYAAKWNGYYAAEGIDVDIRSAFTPEGNILSAPKEVMEGRADFGIGAADILIAENEGDDLSIVASVFQRSAVEYYMKADTPYKSLSDLTKLNTARRKNDLLDIELQAMYLSEGIRPENNRMLPYNTQFSALDLKNGKYDVLPGYLGTISYQAKQLHLPLRIIKPIDYGIDFYGDSLFTSRRLAIVNPDLVERFRRASLKGWEYALGHQEEIAKRIAYEFKVDSMNEKEAYSYNIYQAGKVKGLTFYPVVEIGNINPYRWMEMQNILLKLGLVNGSPDFNDFIFDYNKILEDRRNMAEKIFNAIMLIGFVSFLIFFIMRLSSKNSILEKEIEENRKKEALLIYQARLAAMGEMVANIAHQWRQPLNSLGLIISNLEDEAEYNELETDKVNTAVDKCRKLIARMSETIDDFRYFLNPRNEKTSFLVSENINTVLEMMEENLRFSKIEVIIDVKDEVSAYGYANQYSQAIFNIINNSIDALYEQEIQDRSLVEAV